MELSLTVPLVLGASGLFGLAAGWFMIARASKVKVLAAREQSTRIITDAEKEADTLKREKLLEVKDEWYQKKKAGGVEVICAAPCFMSSNTALASVIPGSEGDFS